MTDDHAGTQDTKRARLAAAGLAVPENARFAAVDFSREALRDGLVRHRVPLDQPTFFSWLGVTTYLPEPAIDSVPRSIAAFPAGTEVVLTFAPPPGDSPSPFDERAASLGEPWVSYFTPDALEVRLRNAGFSRVVFLSPEEAAARYFRHRPNDLPIPARTNIASAVR